MKTKHLVIGVVVIVVAIGLLAVGRFTGTTATGFWRDTDIECLTQGHQNLSQHFHPTLEIIEEGRRVPLPANIGVSGTCLAELHTHDSSGTLHVESVSPDRRFTLDEFFTVWEESIERDGEMPQVEVDGVLVARVEDVELAEGQRIRLIYGEDIPEGERATTTSEVSTTTIEDDHDSHDHTSE